MERLSYWEYIKEAFHRKVYIPLLGMMPLNKMGLGLVAVAGFINPGFWLFGAAIEAGYLFWIAGNERFQNLVDAERLVDIQESWSDKVHQAVQKLSPPARERYRKLLTQCRLILGISETLDTDSLGNFRDIRAQSLNQLLGIFLRLLTSRELITTNIEGLDRSKLERETDQLEERLLEGNEDSALTRSLRGTLEIHRRRLENLDRGMENLRVIDAELERIEKQVELIREESAVSGKPEFLSTRLDAVTTTMSETSRWIDDHSDFFGSLGGADSVTVTELPDLPVEKE